MIHFYYLSAILALLIIAAIYFIKCTMAETDLIIMQQDEQASVTAYYKLHNKGLEPINGDTVYDYGPMNLMYCRINDKWVRLCR